MESGFADRINDPALNLAEDEWHPVVIEDDDDQEDWSDYKIMWDKWDPVSSTPSPRPYETLIRLTVSEAVCVVCAFRGVQRLSVGSAPVLARGRDARSISDSGVRAQEKEEVVFGYEAFVPLYQVCRLPPRAITHHISHAAVRCFHLRATLQSAMLRR